MKLAKTVLALCIVAVLGSALSACVVLPVPYRHGHHHRYP